MKKILSIKYTDFGFNLALLILRLASGILMMAHGYGKLIQYAEKKDGFMDFMGLGGPVSFALLIFAEFFCAAFIAAGLFTRLAAIPLIFAMSVALTHAHGGDVFGKGEVPALFLVSFTTILLLGPGKFSDDGVIGK
ncbi:MAG: DoxX family protein [Bacteroidetes bacterium]|nr:DoxX family protein [Bacteroidota bacterium]